jgi:hypothetical protein
MLDRIYLIVQSRMKYDTIVCDSFIPTNINKLERIQKQTAKFIPGDYKSGEECIPIILNSLELQDIQTRRTNQKLIL